MKLSKRRQKGEGRIVSHPAVAATSFEAALDAYVNAHDGAGHSKVTQEDYRRVVRSFLRYMGNEHGYTNIQQITESDIFAWLSHLRNTPTRFGKSYSSRSIETYSRTVFAFFNWLTKHLYLAVNPMAQVGVSKAEKALIRVFSEEELERLDVACDRAPYGKSLTTDERKTLAARDRAILWLLLSTEKYTNCSFH